METLRVENVLLHVPSEEKLDAVQRVGRQLVANGYVAEPYIDGMIAREHSLTTYIGNGVAIPHGMPEYVQYIKHSGIVIAQYRDGVDFGDGNLARLVVGIAGIGEQHMEALSKIALVCQDEESVEKLVQANDPKVIVDIIEQESLS
jgi:mannitol PTS system EIIA component